MPAFYKGLRGCLFHGNRMLVLEFHLLQATKDLISRRTT
jgi:hypothetical protein